MRGLAGSFVVAVVLFVGVAIFERFAPRSWVRSYWKVVNPIFRAVAGIAPGMAIIETIGRRTGRPHPLPVTMRREGQTMWIVAAHASRADYVRNIEKDPRVRVRLHRRWRTGRARVERTDDAAKRALWINPINAAFLRIASGDLVTIRIDLDERSLPA